MTMTAQDLDRVVAAIAEAERRTSGEIVCVVTRRASTYGYFPLVWSAMAALALPLALIAFTELSAQRIYLAQMALFAAGFALLSLPALRPAIVPRTIKRARAFQAAVEQFHIRGLAGTRARTGLLVFVALEERYARIVVDEAVAGAIDQREWQGAVDRLVAGARAGRLAEGCVAAIEACAAILSRHFPPRDDDVNELPDKVFLL